MRPIGPWYSRRRVTKYYLDCKESRRHVCKRALEQKKKDSTATHLRNPRDGRTCVRQDVQHGNAIGVAHASPYSSVGHAPFDVQEQAARSIHKKSLHQLRCCGLRLPKVSLSSTCLGRSLLLRGASRNRLHRGLPTQWYARHGARPDPSATCHGRRSSLSPKCSCSVFCILF